MTVPYTYCITHKPSGKRYYGARYAKGCHPKDLWINYFTSSTTVKQLIDVDGKDSFSFEVRRTFSDSKSCTQWERKVLIRLGVPRNNKWLNKYSGSSLTQEEMKQAIFNKYGVTHQSKLESVKEQKRQKSLAKYGTSSPMQNESVKNKAKETVLKRYGVNNISKIPELKERISNAISLAHQSNPQIVCPKCGYSCKSASNMRRYHFDNCKNYDILRLHNEQLSPIEIQRITGVERHSVSKHLRFLGVTPNKKGVTKQ